jgi:mono/diheme cytochrome c family protein
MRFKIFYWVLFTAFLSGLLSQALALQGEKDLLNGNPARGRELFVSKGCLECHSIRGVGGTVGPDLGLKVFNKSVYEIGGILWNHSPFMAQKMVQMGIQRPDFEATELLDLISFLYFLNYFDPAGDLPGKTGPRLDQMENPPTAVFLAQSMWNHGAQMMRSFQRLNVDPPTFLASEMVDLAAFIRQANRDPRRKLFSLGDPLQGETLFVSKGCASCHTSGRGQAPQLSGSQLQASVSQIAGQMWNHLPRMYERMTSQGIRFPTFSGEEMNHLISYLYSLAYIGRPGDVKKGQTVFEEKGCIQCHGPPGTGEPILGPDLATISLDSPLGTIPAMWNHALEMEGNMKAKEIVWPRFEGSDMADLQVYLQASHKESDQP